MKQVTYLAICKCGAIVGCISCEGKELKEYQTVISNWMLRGLSIVPGKKAVDPQQCTCGHALPPPAHNLKSLRAQHRLTQKEFATLFDVSRSCYAKYESGANCGKTTNRTLIDLCLHFPVVIKFLKILRGVDLSKGCENCQYYDTCTTKGGPECLSFKPKVPIRKR